MVTTHRAPKRRLFASAAGMGHNGRCSGTAEDELIFLAFLALQYSAALALISAVLIASTLVLGQARPQPEQVLYEAGRSRSLDLHLLDIEHRMTVNLTRSGGRDINAVWSPDGRFIAFESRRDGYNRIYIMDHLGGGLRPLIDDTTLSQYLPLWSPDSQYVYFRLSPGSTARVYQVRVADGNVRQVNGQDLPATHHATYGADHYLVMSDRDGAWGIYRYDLREGLVQLTNNNVRFGEVPAWSRDGARIAFISHGAGNMEVYVMDADGGRFRQITRDGIYKRNLVWRP